MQHRTNNLFAVIQSIINCSVVEGQTAAQIKEILTGRLDALARAHTILAGAAWEGAPLSEILKREFGDFAKHVNVSSCDIVINARAAHQLALIVHELTTNAFKYGALSVPEGRIPISGNIEQSNGTATFSLLWKERSDPPVSGPTREGFGSVILIDAVG